VISKDNAFAQTGPFWVKLQQAIREGVRDIHTGLDRISYDHLDPRVEGGGTLDYALQRVLAEVWRGPDESSAVCVTLLFGRFIGGGMAVTEITMEQWPVLEEIHFAADGSVGNLSKGGFARRLRLDDIEPLGETEGPGDMTLVVGLAAGEISDPVIRRAAALAGVSSGLVVLFLYEPNPGPVDIGEVGGSLVNGWHPALAASNHMSGSFLSASYLQIMDGDSTEPWYDSQFRDKLFETLKPGADARGMPVTKRSFLEALAEASPLRKRLPRHLTNYFPLAERVFWTLQEGVLPGVDIIAWDESSPTERLGILTARQA